MWLLSSLDFTVSILKKDVVFSAEFATAFFDEIPLHNEGNDCDIFAMFGKVYIVCCERALYHFWYKKDIQHEKNYDECLAYKTECNCVYSLDKKKLFSFLCSNCQFNFLKIVSNRFKKIKNDWNLSWDD